MPQQKLAIYIHWPFCKSKCPYCDFNSHVSDSIDQQGWLEAYLKEINYFSELIEGKEISSIFFGGGTPTLMNPAIAEKIINKLGQIGTLANDVEITLEGNPTSAEANKFKEFKHAGINRVSIGIQSMNDDDLKFLGREHSVSEALKAVDAAADVFDNYSFDLIYCLPEQKLSDWEKDLQKAMKYVKHHLSLYQLTIEKGTAFYGDHKRKKFVMPDEELSTEFYEFTDSFLENEGFPAYEISNYARSGMQSRHNLTYWRYGDYLGIGPGAHSRITLNGQKTSQMMIHNPANWLKSVSEKQHGIQEQAALNADEIAEEVVMMGLRIKDGITCKDFKEITGFDIEKRLKKIPLLCDEGLLELDKHSLRTTKSGALLLNSVIAKLLG